MTEREWDKRLHIRTIGREDEANPNYSPYEPTPYSVLERLAGSGHIKRRDHLLDYGCGKGRVAFFMASAVGCRVTGIDHSQKLIDIAKENRRTSRLGDRVTLRCCRAEQYEVEGEDVFFFFNPFSEKVFESVLRRLARRKAGKLICYYPSEAYTAWLDLMPEVEHVDTLDCRDLFNGKDERERIEVYRLREVESMGHISRVYGNPNAPVVLIQMVDDHDLAGMESEVAELRRLTDMDFCLMAVKVRRWNDDLSPWPAPAVFGREGFGDGAADTLAEVLGRCADRDKTYIIGGYSLAGLFALWTAYQTDVFSAVAAASPSVWFPGFLDYMRTQRPQAAAVYLSLGDREERTRNPVMATVGMRIREAHDLLKEQGLNTILEWNQGNHFKDADLRTARAFAWAMQEANPRRISMRE